MAKKQQQLFLPAGPEEFPGGLTGAREALRAFLLHNIEDLAEIEGHNDFVGSDIDPVAWAAWQQVAGTKSTFSLRSERLGMRTIEAYVPIAYSLIASSVWVGNIVFETADGPDGWYLLTPPQATGFMRFLDSANVPIPVSWTQILLSAVPREHESG